MKEGNERTGGKTETYRMEISPYLVKDFNFCKPARHTVCHIETTVENPVIQSTNRSQSPKDRNLYKKILNKRLRDVIKKSYAPWSNNSVIVKKDGKLRMAITYRSLNKITEDKA